MTIRVVLADDHAVVRKGVREFLEEEPDIEVVGEAGDGQQAVQLAVALQPNVVVMDVAMPELSGVEATKRIRSLAPSMRVLALTAYDDEPYIFGLLDAGVTGSGYMLKTAESREIVRAVRATAAGRAALDPTVASRVVARAMQPQTTVAETLLIRNAAVDAVGNCHCRRHSDCVHRRGLPSEPRLSELERPGSSLTAWTSRSPVYGRSGGA